MPKFIRSKPKIDDAEWALAQIRTAARLQDLFRDTGDRATADDGTADARDDGQPAATHEPVIIGPWNGGPRPPIIVGTTRLGGAPAERRTVKAEGAWIEAKARPAAPEPEARIEAPAPPDEVEAVVVVEPDRELAVEDQPMAAGAEIGRVAVEDHRAAEPPRAEEDEVPVELSPMPTEADHKLIDALLGSAGAVPGSVEPVAVMAESWDDTGEDTWRLPAAVASEPARTSPKDRAAARPPKARATKARSQSARPTTKSPTKPKAATARPARPAKAAPRTAPAKVAPAKVAPAKVAPAKVAPAKAAPRTTTRPTAQRAVARRAAAAVAQPALPPTPIAHCPYCAVRLDPVPTASRRCDRCRQRIVVKRVQGATVYLTEAAVLVFESERRRVATSARLIRERDRWLRLAASAGAPTGRHDQLATARLTEDVVRAARALYMTTVDRAFRAAKHEQAWDDAARLRREQAAALYRIAGSPVPPPDALIALVREGVAAELRGISAIARSAELVSARCCDICLADDRQPFRIALELRAPRLPHVGCPKGLCRCHFDLLPRDRLTMRRYLRRRPATEARPGVDPQRVADEPVPIA